MKNKMFTSAYPVFNYFFLLHLFLFLLVQPLKAQNGRSETEQPDTIYSFQTKKSYGLNMSGLYTGSSLGFNLNPSLYYRYNKNLVALGPNIQHVYFNVSGIQSYFQHDLASNLKKMVIYYHISLLYHIKANLSPVSAAQYKNIYGEVSELKYSALENYIGFGLSKGLSEQINFDSSIGVGAYYTINPEKHPHPVPFRPDEDFSLLVKLGITYGFKK